MSRPLKEIKISFAQVEISPEEQQQKIDSAFNLLFDELTKKDKSLRELLGLM